MARSLKNKPQVQAPTSTYPFGRILDDDGSGNGTPVNEDVYGDFHQFFETLMNAASINANELPDNEYNGFQFINALKTLIVNYISSNSSGLKRTIINIGTWNMQSNSSITVAHGLPDFRRIRRVSAMIIADDGSTTSPLDATQSTSDGTMIGCVGGWDSNNITLRRTDSKAYSNASFSGSQNRGYIVIDYLP